MTMSSNQLFDCLELNTSSTKHNIEDYLHQQRSSTNSLCHLLIDVDTTLERLYGGYHADWLSGGEWSHLHSYILSLLKTCQDLSLCLIFCFDGTLYRSGESQWYYEQIQQRKKVNQIFKHLKQNKLGLPRRHLWLSPAAFQLCFRLILRQLNSSHLIMYQTYGYGYGQHQTQLKSYARQYASSLIGIVSSDIEFFFPSENNEEKFLCKYFSSKHLKLSLKGQITLVQIQLNQIKEKFNFNNQQFALFLTLLGNHILSESDLNHFHNDLLHTTSKTSSLVSPSSTNDLSISEACSPDNTSEDQQQQISSNQSRSTDQLCLRLVEFIKKNHFENENDIKSISNEIFKHVSDDDIRQNKCQLIIDSYQYYYQAIDNSIQLENSSTSFSSSQVSINKSDDNLLLENASSGINIEILRTALNLHKQGFMMPWVFQCLYKHEITFSVSIEPEMCTTIPNICEFYRPIRKYLYSILFERSTIIREQVYNSEHGSYLTEISSEYLSSKPTIEQLWFGTNPDEDRTIRLKTFLQSLIHCDLPIISSQTHEYLLLICLLRYIFMEMNRSSTTIFHTYELLAFLSQAVLINELKTLNLSNIQIKTYETRAIQLAHLFVRGYETIMFANEITGAPIHPKYSCLTTIFHGKYFHQKYLQAQYYQQNQDLILILADGNVHCAQIISHLFDIILDRSGNNHNQTPIQQQQQYSVVPPQHQRILKQERTQKFVANSTRPPMRNNYKQIEHNQQQTPITNFRQQQQQQAPPQIKQQAQIRNGTNKKPNTNNNLTPFNIKNQSQTKKLQSHTPIQLNQPILTNEQWNSNHLIIPNQQTHTINNIQTVPTQHYQTINTNYLNQIDEQFLHLQIQPQPILSTPIAYSHPSAMLTPQIPIIPYGHIHPSPYSLPTYYQTTTPYQPLPQTQVLPGLPPHAPMHPQRTTTYPPQRLSPTSMQTFQQQTPISIQRQVNRLPNLDYSQFDIYHSTPSTTMPIPAMLIDHTQRLHGH